LIGDVHPDCCTLRCNGGLQSFYWESRGKLAKVTYALAQIDYTGNTVNVLAESVDKDKIIFPLNSNRQKTFIWGGHLYQYDGTELKEVVPDDDRIWTSCSDYFAVCDGKLYSLFTGTPEPTIFEAEAVSGNYFFTGRELYHIAANATTEATLVYDFSSMETSMLHKIVAVADCGWIITKDTAAQQYQILHLNGTTATDLNVQATDVSDILPAGNTTTSCYIVVAGKVRRVYLNVGVTPVVDGNSYFTAPVQGLSGYYNSTDLSCAYVIQGNNQLWRFSNEALANTELVNALKVVGYSDTNTTVTRHAFAISDNYRKLHSVSSNATLDITSKLGLGNDGYALDVVPVYNSTDSCLVFMKKFSK
jgi:hypothetical protein